MADTETADPMEFMRATTDQAVTLLTCDWQIGERALVQQMRAELRVGACMWGRGRGATTIQHASRRGTEEPQSLLGGAAAHARPALVRAAKELPCADWHHGLRSGGGMSAA